MKIQYVQRTKQKQKLSRRTIAIVAGSVIISAMISALIFFNIVPNHKARASGPNRFWVGKSGVMLRFNNADAINAWALVDNNGTGSFGLTSDGNARLLADDAAGGYSVSLENLIAGSPNLITPDLRTGKIEFKIQDISVDQNIQILAKQFNTDGNYLSSINISPLLTQKGNFIFQLNTILFSPAMSTIQFVLQTDGTGNTQGYVDLSSFNYTTSKTLWSNPANWSVSSNGPGGAGVPTASGLAIFDVGSGDCFIDTIINVLGIDLLTTYTGTVRQGNQVLNVNSSHFDILGGCFIGSDANIQLNNGRLRYTGGTFIATSGNIITNRDLTLTGPSFFHSNGRFVINDFSVTITSTVDLYDLTFISNTATRVLTIPATTGLNITHDLSLEGSSRIDLNSGGKINIQGDLHLLNTFNGGQGTANIVFNGTTDQRIYGTANPGMNRLPDDVIVDKPSGTLLITRAISPVRNLTIVSGTVDAVAATLCLNTTGSSVSGNWSFSELIFDSNGVSPAANNTYTITDNSTLTVLNKMTITGTSNSIINRTGSGKIILQGDLELNATGTAGSGSCLISFEGIKDQVIAGNAAVSACRVPHIAINKTAGSLRYTGTISSAGDLEYIRGNVDPGNSNFIFTTSSAIRGKARFHNLTYSRTTTGTNTQTISDTISVLNNFEQNGIGTITITGGVIDLHKNAYVTNTALGGNSSMILNLIGTTDQIISGTSTSGQGRLGGIQINKNSGTLFLENFITLTRDWTYMKGDVNSGQSTVLMGSNTSNLITQNASNSMSFNNISFYSSLTNLRNELMVTSNLEILSGATLDVTTANNNVDLKGDWKNFGTFTRRDGTVKFSGSIKQNILSGTKENFNNLHFANTAVTADAIQLGIDVQVFKTFTLQTSKVFLNNFNMTIGSGRTASTIGSVRVINGWLHGGSLTRWLLNTRIAENDSAGFFPLGSAWDSRGVYISNPVVISNGGSITLTHNPSAQVVSVSVPDAGLTIVNRLNANWIVSNSGITSGLFNLKMGGTGFGTIGNINDLRLMMASSVIATPGTNSGNTVFPWISRNGLLVTDLNNQFYIGSSNRVQSPLPVTLLSFKASLVEAGVLCKWSTASELNNDYFNVEHSTDGGTYKTIAKIKGSGTTNQIRFYEFTHREAVVGNNYYRLRQTDTDGKYEIFDPVAVMIKSDKNAASFEIKNVYPNPFVDQFSIELKCNMEGEIKVMMNNITGAKILEMNENIHTGFNEIHVKTESEIPSGTYVLTLIDEEGNKQSIRIIKRN